MFVNVVKTKWPPFTSSPRDWLLYLAWGYRWRQWLNIAGFVWKTSEKGPYMELISFNVSLGKLWKDNLHRRQFYPYSFSHIPRLQSNQTVPTQGDQQHCPFEGGGWWWQISRFLVLPATELTVFGMAFQNNTHHSTVAELSSNLNVSWLADNLNSASLLTYLPL